MRKDLVIRKKCVLCESKKLKTVLDFKKTPLANSYVKYLNSKEKYYPLVCVLCLDCKHLQLKHLVEPTILFKNYMYVSGTSPVLVKIISHLLPFDKGLFLELYCPFSLIGSVLYLLSNLPKIE